MNHWSPGICKTPPCIHRVMRKCATPGGGEGRWTGAENGQTERKHKAAGVNHGNTAVLMHSNLVFDILRKIDLDFFGLVVFGVVLGLDRDGASAGLANDIGPWDQPPPPVRHWGPGRRCRRSGFECCPGGCGWIYNSGWLWPQRWHRGQEISSRTQKIAYVNGFRKKMTKTFRSHLNVAIDITL